MAVGTRRGRDILNTEQHNTTQDEVRQAEIEVLEMQRHAYKMQIAAIEKRLAMLGKTYKNNTTIDKKNFTR
jgi:chaperonin cofactor prefoldin